AHAVRTAGADGLLLEVLGGMAWCALAGELVGDIADRVRLRMGEDGGRPERTFDCGAGEEWTGGVRRECRDVQAFHGRAVPVRRAGGVFERNAAAGEVLGEAAP